MFIVLAIVAIKLLFFAVGVFTLVAWGVTGLLLFAAVGYLCFLLFKGSQGKASRPDAKAEPQVWNHSGNVVLFEEKPSLLQITKVDDTMAGIIKLPNGEGIKVLEEAENALKVKVLSGAHKGNLAWVSKSDVTGYKSNK